MHAHVSMFLFQSVGVSSIRGDGINEFFTLVDSAREEFARLGV